MKFVVLGLAISIVAQGTHKPGTLGELLAREGMEFAWPAGTVANVDTEYVAEAGVEQARQISRLRMTHQIRVVEQGDERLIHYTNQTRVDSSGDPLRALGGLLPLWVPTSVVSDRGLLRRIEGAGQLRKLVTDMVQPQFTDPAQAPRLREWLKFGTSDEGLYQMAMTEWLDLVGRWTGRSLKDEAREITGAIALYPGVMAPTKETISLIGRATCLRGGKPRDCATWEHRSRIDRASLDPALKSLIDTRAGLPANFQFRDHELVVRVTLEIQTMLPHELTRTRTMHAVAELNGRSSLATETERRHSQFTYVRFE
ncbi:MAG TPA: hypothetical protein VM096_18310 [Vicinamibacterales bacterium]|nr:hypothetical protein [Vicinamibacterales bacterium]